MATAKEVLQDKFSKWGVVCSLDGDITLSSKRGLNALDIIETMQEYATSLQRFEWQDTKPEFKEDCLLITAIQLKTPLMSPVWEYALYEIKWTEGEREDGTPGYYWGIFCEDGDEWGDIADLKADRYLVLPLIK